MISIKFNIAFVTTSLFVIKKGLMLNNSFAYWYEKVGYRYFFMFVYEPGFIADFDSSAVKDPEP